MCHLSRKKLNTIRRLLRVIYDFKNIIKGKNPSQLLRTFTVFSFVSIIGIFFLTYFGIRQIYLKEHIKEAEHDAIGISQAIFQHEREMLLTSVSKGENILNADPKDFATIDESMKRFLNPLNIVKIKMFSRDRKIVYSTDRKIVGTIDVHNEKLNRALGGEVVSKLEKKDEVSDILGEQRFDVDLVETYLPVKDENNEIIGCFELYFDISRYNESASRALQISLIVTSVLLGIVFGILYFLMRQGMKELSKTQKSLEKLSATDGLTGIFNRRYLFSRINEEHEKTKRKICSKNSKDTVGYIMIDIDGFKKINDTYGHLVGDEILKELAKRLQISTRKYDVVGRYGGEEFLVILPNSNIDDTKFVAERIWQTIRDKPFIVNESLHRITVSLGIDCSTADDKNLEDFLGRVDEALYKAKKLGRDRIAGHDKNEKQADAYTTC